MNIRIRVVTPITTEGFRTPEDAASLASEGVDVSFVNIDAGPAAIECHDKERFKVSSSRADESIGEPE
ncbi:MAG: hypothetical protein WAL59_11050, partial [Roseiarcus sp.]